MTGYVEPFAQVYRDIVDSSPATEDFGHFLEQHISGSMRQGIENT